MKSCINCGGELYPLDAEIIKVLPPGLHKGPDGVLPVPTGCEYRCHQTSVACADCGAYYDYMRITNGDMTMTEGMTPAQAAKAAEPTRAELLEKVRRLNESIANTTALKKSTAKHHNDDLKNYNLELTATLDRLKATNPDNATA